MYKMIKYPTVIAMVCMLFLTSAYASCDTYGRRCYEAATLAAAGGRCQTCWSQCNAEGNIAKRDYCAWKWRQLGGK
jgi:hypothetical protein